MFRSPTIRRLHPLVMVLAGLACASLASADDMASFATGGYARGLQTKEMMHKIDTDGDGTVSHDEFIVYETKVFDMMNKNHTASLGPQEFLGK